MAEATLLLVDGNNLLFRSFFAMPRLTRSDGLPNGALHGFVATLRKILREEAPEYAAVAFDAPGPTFRHEAYPEYKANRPEMPPELAQQVPFTRDLSRVLGVTVVEVAGVEADDVIGTLARAGSGRGYRVLVVSGDKDLLQLVDDRVSVVPPADTAQRLDRAGVEAKLSVPPERVPDYLGLVGDSVDNIPGVPGIGPKTAATLIASFGGVEEILAHTAEIPRKRTATLLDEHAASARLSRELARLRLDVGVPEAGEGLQGLRYGGPRLEDARQLLEELELRTHARDLSPAPAARLPEVRTATGPGDVVRLLERARDAGRLSVHATFGPVRGRDPAPLTALGLASSAGEGLLVAVGERIGERDLVEALRPALADGVALVGHEVQPFVRWWLEQGGDLPAVAHDSQVAAWLLNTTRRAQGFGDVLRDYVGLSLPEAEASPATLFGTAAPDKRIAIAAAWQHRLAEKLDGLLETEGLMSVFRDIEMPLLPVLARIETRGICLDSGALRGLSKDLQSRLEELTARIHELAGTPFDIQSPKQLGEILFDKLQLPQTAKTQKTKRASTRAGVLEELADYHEVPRLVLEYREVAKLKSTYVDPLPELVAPGTGRLHTRLHQAVAATGRLSSTDPNLQNIPVRSDLGRQVRKAFVAAPGKRLLSADYSQIELRILAHLSGDPVLIEAFRSGEDIHARTANEVFGDFGLSPGEARRRAKIVNFSVIYGKTAFTLAKEIGVSTGEAKAFIDAYFDRYARVRDLIESIREEARTTGRVTTLFGRQRHIPEIRTTQRARREAAERMAVNAPIQGTAADLIKIAMLGVDRALLPTSAVVLLQVHDELLIEVEPAEAEAVGELVRREMESVAELRVPLVADVTIADSWEH
ncbi:MAG: DNA polymerase I [Acidobacteriota bacterium]|nr:DNA polymerase I [Acidobacteriota bacterium]